MIIHRLAFAAIALTIAGGQIRTLAAETVKFRRVVINADSTYPACAVLDLNGDGKKDIISGGLWYEAPNWKRHVVRQVQQIRGRFDDYSNLPMDVDGDGHVDLISCNYRSKSLYWVKNPGRPGKLWTRHVIDTPGSMETGRLADVNGDGQLDVLPNGTRFAAWWEKGRSGMIRHDLPQQLAGHGIGIGDIDGDGRKDLVSAQGWFRAPADRRSGRWTWQPEFKLPRDCSIPILVWDVDGDQDQDIVWGRGHNIGLYWLEQTRDANSKRRWIRHTIDNMLSEPHSILAVDVDKDGRTDLVAGKRYMGHDGKDPGEYDPLAVYWYSFDDKTRSWRRKPISFGARAGFGLDPKAVDLDGDGDVDFVGAGRSGLYVFENLLINKQKREPTRTTIDPPAYDDHSQLLKVRRSKLEPVKTPADWALRRHHILEHMQAVMGRLPNPARRVPLDVRWKGKTVRGSYARYELTFVSEPGDRVPAFLLVPLAIARSFDPKDGYAPAPRRAAAMLCLHQTTRIGKKEPAGLGGRKSLHYAHELAERGFICLVPDYPSFGDYPFDFKAQAAKYKSGTMKAIWNNIRAVDLLESLPIVQDDRIGVIGHSLGGHNSLFTAAFDQRLRAVVTSCGFTAFHHYYGGKLAGWTSDRYMPRIRTVHANDPDRVPFDFYEVLAAIAPRGIFVCAPTKDSNFDVVGVRKVMSQVQTVFDLRGAGQKIVARYPKSAHDFPEATRTAAYLWLDKTLKAK